MSRPLLALLLALLIAPAQAQETIVLRGRLHDGAGKVDADGLITVRDGKLVSVTSASDDFELPAGARLITFPGAELTPGLIDASAQAVSTREWEYAEQSAEVIPHLRVLDSLVFDSNEWDHVARRGVTTVYVTADPTSVIGCRGVTLKTVGERASRVLQEAGAVKVTLGQETWARGVRNRGPRGSVPFTVRRPTTRMGLVWVFRDAFARARAGDMPGPAGDVLEQVLSGSVGLRVQARHQKDLETAFRLVGELGLESWILEEGAEIYRFLDDPQRVEALRRWRVQLIYGPIFEEPRGWRARTDEANRPCLTTPAKLAAAGISFALTAADRIGSDEDSLPAQAMLAIRYGLSPADALAAVTSIPATMLGIQDRVGTLEPGKDADVVVWNGPPFSATSRPVLVLIDGKVVLDEIPAPAGSDRKKQRYK